MADVSKLSALVHGPGLPDRHNTPPSSEIALEGEHEQKRKERSEK